MYLMLTDEQLISLMVNEPSWEDVIIKIVAEEQMDPWNIDIVKLADVFSRYVEKIDKLDLRIPARFILIAAILLRMKSDILVSRKQKILIPESGEKENELLRILAKIPPLEPPAKRTPLRNVSLDELITALKKAFEVSERRVLRKKRLKRAVEKALPEKDEQDINERINNLLERINEAITQIEEDVEFSRLVKNWNRREIVRTLLPMLHLSQEGKIVYNQKELFKEIKVKVKKHDKKGTEASG